MKTNVSPSDATSRRKLTLTTRAKLAARQAEIAHDRAVHARKTMKAARKAYKMAKKAAKRSAKQSKRLAKELQAFLKSVGETPKQSARARGKRTSRVRRSPHLIPPSPLEVLADAPPTPGLSNESTPPAPATET